MPGVVFRAPVPEQLFFYEDLWTDYLLGVPKGSIWNEMGGSVTLRAFC